MTLLGWTLIQCDHCPNKKRLGTADQYDRIGRHGSPLLINISGLQLNHHSEL